MLCSEEDFPSCPLDPVLSLELNGSYNWKNRQHLTFLGPHHSASRYRSLPSCARSRESLWLSVKGTMERPGGGGTGQGHSSQGGQRHLGVKHAKTELRRGVPVIPCAWPCGESPGSDSAAPPSCSFTRPCVLHPSSLPILSRGPKPPSRAQRRPGTTSGPDPTASTYILPSAWRRKWEL